MARAKTLRQKIADAAAELAKAHNALSGLRALAVAEDVAIRSRLDALREQVAVVARREREAQEIYRMRRDELAELSNGYHQ